MAVNKRKILETARKLAQKGAKDKALKEYQKLLKLDPKDAKLRLEIGDAHRRWGQVGEAIATYTRVAEQYMAEGFDARAVAVYKQIVNLDPDCLEAYTPLAELYERMGLTAEAIGALQAGADGFHRQGKRAEALGLLRRMANADPTNTTSRIKVADLLKQEGMAEEAVAEYLLAAEELERQGEIELLCNAYRRVLEIDETHVGALGALAQTLANRGKVTESLPLAERALELDALTPERFETLANLYEQAGREAERSDVYRRLAQLYRERGDEDTARSILQRHVPSEELAVGPGETGAAGGGPLPDEPGPEIGDAGELVDPAAGDGLFGEGLSVEDGGADPSLSFGNEERLDAPPLPGGAALHDELDVSLPPPEEIELDDEVGGDEELSLEEPTDLSAVQASPAPEVFDVDQLLAEASVYLRYGKGDRAVVHLERVLESDPEHRGALEKLGEAFAEAGESERAVEAWLRAAKRAEEDGDDEGLRVIKGRIGALDPATAERLEGPSEPPAPDPEPAGALEAGPGDEIDLDLGSLEDELSLDPADGPGEELGDDDLLDSPLSMPGIGEGAPAEMPAESPLAGSDQEPGPSESPGASLSASTAHQVQDELEEADFYMNQGLFDEATEIYQRVLAVAPSHPRALLRLGELAAARGESPESASPAAEGATPGGAFDSETLPESFAVDEDVSVPDLRGTPVESDSVEPLAEAGSEAEPDFGLDLPREEPEPAAEELGGLSDLDLEDAPDAAEEPEAAEADGSDTEELAAVGAAGDFDLAAALADAFDDEGPGEGSSGPASDDDGFEAVFGAFKKGVSETLGEGDHQAHYDLAIAYKEMGLYDDAMAELDIAMADASRIPECLHLIALCALDADRAPAAVEQLERLLALPDLPAEAALAGRFDLGRALLAVGDPEGARAAWTEVAGERPGFRDVSARLAGLDAGGSEPGAGLESFDDVMEAVLEDDDAPEPEGAAPEAEPVPEAGPEPPAGGDGGPTGRKKKKISFL